MRARHCIIYLAVSVSYKVYTGYTYRITSDRMWLSIYSRFCCYFYVFRCRFSCVYFFLWHRSFVDMEANALTKEMNNAWQLLELILCLSNFMFSRYNHHHHCSPASRLVGRSIVRWFVGSNTSATKLSWSTWRVTSINYFDKHGNFCVRFCSQSTGVKSLIFFITAARLPCILCVNETSACNQIWFESTHKKWHFWCQVVIHILPFTMVHRDRNYFFVALCYFSLHLFEYTGCHSETDDRWKLDWLARIWINYAITCFTSYQ